jgi:O-antigen ligase
MLTLAIAGRLRRPSLVLFLALAFTMLNVLSLLWTIDAAASFVRLVTYGQLLGLAWLIWEFARTLEEQQSLMIAYCLGAYVCLIDLLRSFLAGERVANHGLRYSGLGFDPNDLGLMLALGIPMAWHVFLNRKGIIRFAAASYVPLAVVGILLTASRGAFLSGIVALSIVPLTLPRRSLRSIVLVAGGLIAAGSVALIVPQSSWDRILTTGDELRRGTLGGRGTIWAAGLQAFQDHVVLGAGAGAFEASVEPLLGPRAAPHNVFLAILVEQGIVGVLCFVALLAACGWTVYRLRGSERKVWVVMSFIWLVGAMSLNWQYRKITWLMFGLLSAQAAVRTARHQSAESETVTLAALPRHSREGVPVAPPPRRRLPQTKRSEKNREAYTPRPMDPNCEGF